MCVYRFGTQPDRSVFSLWAWLSTGAPTAAFWSTTSRLRTPLRLWTAGGMSSWSKLALATLRTSPSSCWETRSTWRTDRSEWASDCTRFHKVQPHHPVSAVDFVFSNVGSQLCVVSGAVEILTQSSSVGKMFFFRTSSLGKKKVPAARFQLILIRDARAVNKKLFVYYQWGETITVNK